jgi:cytochrome c oxidase subunit II
LIDTHAEFRHLLELYLPVMLVVFAIILGVVLFALVRYRAGTGRTPSSKSDAPVLESAYALVLVAVVAVFVWATFTTETKVDRVSSDPGLRVDVVAFKWQWRFAYPDENVRPIVGTEHTQPTLVVPTRTTIQFALTSRDVIHAFWIPAVRFKRDAFPRRMTEFDLVFDHPGTFAGRCAEFCGLDHADMTFVVRALPPEQFRSWVAQHS